MMIANGWLDWAARDQGPTTKLYLEVNKAHGIVCHSIEGKLPPGRRIGRMFDLRKDASGRYLNAMSTMFTLPKDGKLIQNYPVFASTWTSGNREANTTLWAVEAEGRAGEPLTAGQVGAMVRLTREWESYTGKKARRNPRLRLGEIRTLWEHNEVALWSTPNAGPTSCPSHRYNEFFNVIDEEEVDMTPEETQSLIDAKFDPLARELARLNQILSKRNDLAEAAFGPAVTVEAAWDALGVKRLIEPGDTP